jgi:hypothetical protein
MLVGDTAAFPPVWAYRTIAGFGKNFFLSKKQLIFTAGKKLIKYC